LLAGLDATLDFECEFQIKIDATNIVRRKFLVQEQMSYRRYAYRGDVDAGWHDRGAFKNSTAWSA